MNSNGNYSRKLLVTCCGAALAMGLLAVRAQADPWDKKTYLTVNQTFQVTDKVLPAGTYVLKLMDSPSNRHVVQIFNKDQSRILDTILAIPNYRLRPTGRSQFLFWETPPGAAPALRAWFYPGDNFGQEFPYPKHIAMLQTTTQTTEQSRMNQQSETKQETTTVKQEADRVAEPAPEPTEALPAPPAEAPVEMAQNTPPPAPAAEPVQTPSELPKTASPYPWIGLAGLFFVSMYGALRWKGIA